MYVTGDIVSGLGGSKIYEVLRSLTAGKKPNFFVQRVRENVVVALREEASVRLVAIDSVHVPTGTSSTISTPHFRSRKAVLGLLASSTASTSPHRCFVVRKCPLNYVL